MVTIRAIEQIRVHLIATPRLSDSTLEFLSQHNTEWRQTPGSTDAERLIEFSGRVCYMAFGEQQSPKTARDYIRHLVTQGHESVLEHATWSFVIDGLSRAAANQITRHRAGWAFSQLSQQYHDGSNSAFVLPREVMSDETISAGMAETFKATLSLYSAAARKFSSKVESTELEARERKRRARTFARAVLPNATQTVLAASANARALRHFFKIRGNIPGDPEMRWISARLFEAVSLSAPSVFEDFQVISTNDAYGGVAVR